jgi:hypothetical protein
MNDLTAVGIFFGCLIATFALLRACEWLLPREQPRGDTDTAVLRKEPRQ